MTKKRQTRQAQVASPEADDPSRKMPKSDTTTTTAEETQTHTAPNNNNDKWFSVFTKGDQQYEAYMTHEWGFEKRGDVPLFEKLSLEGAQSGLSWHTILRKRENYRRTFYQFDPQRVVANMTAAADDVVEDILAAPPERAVVRHRGKILSVINNAQCILRMRAEKSDKNSNNNNNNNNNQQQVFDEFLWSFVQDKPILRRRSFSEMPSKTAESEAMSKALKKLGFKFVGPTTCYAMMQSVGMVIDHPVDTPEWKAAYQRLQQRPGGYQEEAK